MQRRDVLRLAMSSTILGAMPPGVLQLLGEAWAEAKPLAGLRTLNEHQNATIDTLSDLIIPETATPGARSAKVTEFIDLMLTEWYDRTDTERFLRGIDGIDAASTARFGKAFVQCSESQQTSLMKVWDNEGMRYAQAAKASRRANKPLPVEPFFYTVKRLTLVGYYTSEIGFSKELGKQIIPTSHAGCAPLSKARS